MSGRSDAPGAYRPDVDGLRAVAVLAVVGYHAFPGAVRGGFVGVDVFFVISGYLITTLILADLRQGSFSLLEFYRRRVRRIFPALLLVMAAVGVFGWFALLPHEYALLGKHLAAGAGFVSNLALWSEAGYFDEVAETKLLLHLWSLAIEEQFYLVWPLLLAWAWRRRWPVVRVCAAIAGASFVWSLLLVGRDPTQAFFSPLPRAWELMAGAVLAMAHPMLVARLERWGTVLSLLGTAALAGALLTVTPRSAFPGWIALLPVLGTVLVIAAGPRAWPNRHLYAARPMVAIGLISYPLYLWHWPLIAYAYVEEGAKPASGIRIAAVGVALLLAWMTYRFVEQPVRQRMARAAVLPVLLSAMLVVGIAGLALWARDGVPSRVAGAERLQVAEEPKPDPASAARCRERFPELAAAAYCFASAEAEPVVAFVGDSHALQFARTLEAEWRQTPYVLIAHTGCLPFTSRVLHELPRCRQVMEAVAGFLQSRPGIRRVFLAGHWGYLSAGDFEANRGSAWRRPVPLTPSRERDFVQVGSDFLRASSSAGREWVALLDVPYLDFNINKCVVQRPLSIVSRPVERCAIERRAHDERNAGYEQALLAVLGSVPGTSTYDPKPLFCDAITCWALRDGRPVYADGDHFNAEGAAIVVRDLSARHGLR